MTTGTRFCGACGAQQKMETHVPEQPPQLRRLPELVSERRDVTVVFVDATNFTATSNRLDSEDVYTFINEAMKLLANVVSEFNGTIDKFTGDGLMALFGAPVAQEDDAERAVRAAWEMQRVIRPLRERLQAQHGFDFRIRIGVHTGEVVAGRIGGSVHAEYTVIGETVNIASRLQASADPDTVLVSSDTYELTWRSFRYEPLPPFALKGIAHLMTAYRLTGLQIGGSRGRGVPGVFIPLVGRNRELAALQDAVNSVIDKRRAETVFITGEAGVGKTRLVNEFVVSLDWNAVRVLGAACTTMTRSRPLAVIADLLRSILGLDGSDSPQTQAEAVHAFCAQHDVSGSEPYVLSVLELSQRSLIAADMLQQRTYAAIGRFLCATAGSGAVAIVIDDLQWIDPGSRAFLEFLVESAADEPLLLLLVSRNRKEARTLLPLAEERDERMREIAVEPLDATQTTQLVARFLSGATARDRAVREAIAQRAEGNPFYVEELVRRVRQRAAVPSRKNDESSVLDDVPPSLRGLILSRVDDISPELRSILQRAAILGRAFPVRLLEYLVEDTTSVARALNELEAREFLQQAPCGFEPGYAFHHALVQEAIHGTLLKRDRNELHVQVAEAIARNRYGSPQERAELLAHHYGYSDEPQRALPYLLTAAERSARRHTHEVTVDHCRRALSILALGSAEHSIEQYHRFSLILASALKFQGNLTEARNLLDTSVATLTDVLVTQDTDVQVVSLFVDLLAELADVEIRDGDLESARQHLDEATLAAAQWSDFVNPHARHALAARMAAVQLQRGMFDEALRLAEDLLQAIETDPEADPAVLADVCNTLGVGLSHRHKYAPAAICLRRSVLLHEANGDRFGQASAQTNLGRVLRLMGKHDEARRAFGAAVKVGADREGAPALVELAHLAVIEERFDAARSYLDSVDDSIVPGWLSALVVADQSLERAISRAREACHDLPSGNAADCSRILGNLYARQGANEAAEQALRQAVQIARTIGDAHREALALLDLAPLRSHGEARGMIEESLRVLTSLGAAFDAARARSRLDSLAAAS